MRIKSGDRIDGLPAALLLLHLQVLTAVILLALRLLGGFTPRRFLGPFPGASLLLAFAASRLLCAAARGFFGPSLLTLLAVGAGLLLNLGTALLSRLSSRACGCYFRHVLPPWGEKQIVLDC